MLGEEFTNKCIVKPGEQVKLDDITTTTLGILGRPKEEVLPIFQGLRSKVANQQRVLYAEGKKRLLIVMQAMDTGGKDGCVRKLFSRVDPQGVWVTPFKAPSTRELSHDFLWRVHKVVPAKGEIAVFNRSHYEDIIAVRVKNLAPEKVWQKRYKHIVDFEQMLVDEGTTVLKFFCTFPKKSRNGACKLGLIGRRSTGNSSLRTSRTVRSGMIFRLHMKMFSSERAPIRLLGLLSQRTTNGIVTWLWLKS